MRELLSGALAAFALVISLHFLRFGRRTRDRFFDLFAAAFLVLAVNSVALGLTDPEDEVRLALYGVRVVSFAIIAVAIVQKNRR